MAHINLLSYKYINNTCNLTALMSRTLTPIFLFLFISFGFAQNGKLLSKKLIDISKTPSCAKSLT